MTDLKAMAEWLDVNLEMPKSPDINKAERFFNDLTKAVACAVKEAKHSEDRELADLVSSVESELDWFSDKFYELTAYAGELDNYACDATHQQESLMRLIYDRMTDEERDEYKVIAVQNQIKGAA